MSESPNQNPAGPEAAPGRFVEAIMQREQEKRAAAAASARTDARAPQSRRGMMLVALLPMLVGLVAWNVALTLREPVVFTPDEESAAIRLKVVLTAVSIEDFRRTNGRLPDGLETLGLSDDGIDYHIVEGRYTLRAESPAGTVTYRDGQDLDRLAGAWDVFRRERR